VSITPTHGGCHGTHPCSALVTPRTESDYDRKCSSWPDAFPAKDLCDDLIRYIKWERCRVGSQKGKPFKAATKFLSRKFQHCGLEEYCSPGLLLPLGWRSEGDIIYHDVRGFAVLYIALSSVLRIPTRSLPWQWVCRIAMRF